MQKTRSRTQPPPASTPKKKQGAKMQLPPDHLVNGVDDMKGGLTGGGHEAPPTGGAAGKRTTLFYPEPTDGEDLTPLCERPFRDDQDAAKLYEVGTFGCNRYEEPNRFGCRWVPCFGQLCLFQLCPFVPCVVGNWDGLGSRAFKFQSLFFLLHLILLSTQNVLNAGMLLNTDTLSLLTHAATGNGLTEITGAESEASTEAEALPSGDDEEEGENTDENVEEATEAPSPATEAPSPATEAPEGGETDGGDEETDESEELPPGGGPVEGLDPGSNDEEANSAPPAHVVGKVRGHVKTSFNAKIAARKKTKEHPRSSGEIAEHSSHTGSSASSSTAFLEEGSAEQLPSGPIPSFLEEEKNDVVEQLKSTVNGLFFPWAAYNLTQFPDNASAFPNLVLTVLTALLQLFIVTCQALHILFLWRPTARGDGATPSMLGNPVQGLSLSQKSGMGKGSGKGNDGQWTGEDDTWLGAKVGGEQWESVQAYQQREVYEHGEDNVEATNWVAGEVYGETA